MNYVSPCSARQIQIMRHALAWPKDCRNYFIVNPGTENFLDCEELFIMSMMRKYYREVSQQYVYIVTELGIKELERIDRSDEVKL